MSHQHYITILLLLCQSIAFGLDRDSTKYISLEKLLSQNKVDASLSGLGGHSGNCMQLLVENKSTDSIFMWVEGGRRLTSEDTTIQDIFIAKSSFLALAPSQKDTASLFGFCCQAKKGSPYSKSAFEVGYMAPENWVHLARFVEKYNFPIDAIQHAVWVLSDGHDIGSIHDESGENVKYLKRKVADLMGIQMPWYSFTYEKDPDVLFTDKIQSIQGDIPFYLNTHCVVSVLIKYQNGKNITYPLKEVPYGPGEYVFRLNQDVSNWGRGHYTVIIYRDYAAPLIKRKFTIS
ncbi:hypothetical protein K6119_13510 [Paracrocinitomix mangrovi]|uniref:hypothetical protein n=1 Tax=Paracrocinitomix mangrovi TaxID=2862509 RepID=UPI001C8E73E6|nr:hypothetical protein [Paracrocinitomix mangrovi]UKN00749.1 hypothetical protein K6119_13510 [Paracrocinitomix mangrovi]